MVLVPVLAATAMLLHACAGGSDSPADPDEPVAARAVAPSASDASPGTSPGAGDPAAGRVHALAVVRGWDAARARALAARDAGALRSLYAPGSGLAAQDLRLLGAYTRRGIRLTDVRHQTVSVDVRVARPRVVEVAVVERLAVVQVDVAGAGRRALPTSYPVQRVLRFERADPGRGGAGTWQLSSATEE